MKKMNPLLDELKNKMNLDDEINHHILSKLECKIPSGSQANYTVWSHEQLQRLIELHKKTHGSVITSHMIDLYTSVVCLAALCHGINSMMLDQYQEMSISVEHKFGRIRLSNISFSMEKDISDFIQIKMGQLHMNKYDKEECLNQASFYSLMRAMSTYLLMTHVYVSASSEFEELARSNHFSDDEIKSYTNYNERISAILNPLFKYFTIPGGSIDFILEAITGGHDENRADMDLMHDCEIAYLDMTGPWMEAASKYYPKWYHWFKPMDFKGYLESGFSKGE